MEPLTAGTSTPSQSLRVRAVPLDQHVKIVAGTLRAKDLWPRRAMITARSADVAEQQLEDAGGADVLRPGRVLGSPTAYAKALVRSRPLLVTRASAT